METTSPSSFPGTTLAERFAAFKAQYEQLAVPQLIGVNASTGGPTFSYINAAGVNMTLAWQRGTTGTAFLSRPGEAVASRVDYSKWPFVYEEVVMPDGTRRTWVDANNRTVLLTPTDYHIPADNILE